MSVLRDIDLPSAYDRLHVAIMLYDPETGAVLDANDPLESLFGYTTSTLRGMSIDEYSANTQSFDEARFLERVREAADGTPQQFTWRVKRADGELRWVSMQLSAYADCTRTYVLAEVSDITDHYIATRRVGLFSRILRHNLRNDVTVIAGRAANIHEESDAQPIQRDAATIQRTSRALGRLTESVKEIDRATTPTVTDRTHRHATEAVADVVDDLRTTYPAADITVAERDELWVHVDEAFDHALRHAIDNAVRHDDSPAPVVDVTVGASPNTGRVEIRIVDNAPPIPESELDAIDDFTQTTSTAHGSGTGLFVMKWCVESLGGELRFDRHEGGNVVSVYLPPKKSRAA